MIRRLGPWAASAAIHAALGLAALLAVAKVTGGPAPDPDATFEVAIRPGGGPRIADAPHIDDRSYGVPQDTVTIDETPLTGVPDLPITRSQFPVASKTGTGEPTRTYRPGPVVRFSGAGEGVGDGRDDGVEAVPLETPSPVYPDAARRKNIQGAVITEIRIDREGRVESALAAEGSGSPLLDDAALAAVRSWRYRPATLRGKPVPSVRRVRFVFRLE